LIDAVLKIGFTPTQKNYKVGQKMAYMVSYQNNEFRGKDIMSCMVDGEWDNDYLKSYGYGANDQISGAGIIPKYEEKEFDPEFYEKNKDKCMKGSNMA